MKVPDAVRVEEAKAKRAQWERTTRSIELGWRRACHDPRAHLAAVTGNGDRSVLYDLAAHERSATEMTLASYLTRLELQEISHAIPYARVATLR